ncbi:MAG: hypothetical protein ACR2M1_02930 [Gemmatimonadaceae bacterium]
MTAQPHAPDVDPLQCVSLSSRDSTAGRWLRAARYAVLPLNSGDSVLKATVTASTSWDYQSDRSYPPYLRAYNVESIYLDPSDGMEGVVSGYESVVQGSTQRRWSDATGTYLRRDTTLLTAPRERNGAERTRMLEPWAVIADWTHDSASVRSGERCEYRDQSRISLERPGQFGSERLLLDAETAFPVALIRHEPDLLWGDIRAAYVYSTWQRLAGGFLPVASFRLQDGVEERSRTIAFDADFKPAASLVARTNMTSALGAPPVATTKPMQSRVAGFLDPVPLDTIRVTSNVFLLHNPGYTEAVALLRDTVYVLDATQGEQRARADSGWVAKLFPGVHPIVVFVTDGAYPHVAGVRFWVAAGATIVTQRITAPLIRQVVNRSWIMRPDELERKRADARLRLPLRLRVLEDSAQFAGGQLRVAHINGAAAEGALAAFIPSSGFLWASDYVQDTRHPSLYLNDIASMVSRQGWTPVTVAAEHIQPVSWSTLKQLTDDRRAGKVVRVSERLSGTPRCSPNCGRL